MPDAPKRLSPPEVALLLDEHHLVVVSDRPGDRAMFSHHLHDALASRPETSVIRLAGGRVTDLDGLCRGLERRFGIDRRVARSMDGVIECLRSTTVVAKRQYLIWEDAHLMLERDAALFERVAGAMLAAAAEREFVTPDVLVLQRAVFTGDERLEACAADERGPFRRWHVDTLSVGDETPFWEVVSCVERPRVVTCRLGEEASSSER